VNVVLSCGDKLPIGFYIFDKNFVRQGGSKFIQGVFTILCYLFIYSLCIYVFNLFVYLFFFCSLRWFLSHGLGASVSAVCELKAGNYIVLPCTFNAKMNGNFNLDLYSETVKVTISI
jgi:hypothetical protein